MESKRPSRVLTRAGKRRVKQNSRRSQARAPGVTDTDDSDSSSRRANNRTSSSSHTPHSRLRVKFHYNGEIRVVHLTADMSFHALLARLTDDYGFQVSLRYEDEDGELITLACQNDLNELFASKRSAVTVRVGEANPSRGYTSVLQTPTPAQSTVLLNPLAIPSSQAGGGFSVPSTPGMHSALTAPFLDMSARRGQLHPLPQSGAAAASGPTAELGAPSLASAAAAFLQGGRVGEPAPHSTLASLGSHRSGMVGFRPTSSATAAVPSSGEGQAAGNGGGGERAQTPPRTSHSSSFVGDSPAALPFQPGGRDFKWQRGEKIGRGAFGTVFVGLNLVTGELMAVKHLDTAEVSARELASLEHEITLMKGMHHPNIVQYLGTTRDKAALCIFLEYVTGGSIRQMLERFGQLDETVVRTYTRQLLLGLEYLHRNGIAHRDIKGANVLVSNDGTIKLADFGASKRLGANSTVMSGTGTGTGGNPKGTPLWMAPEVIKATQSARGWKKADVWSVGCTVIEMLTGQPPWSEFTNHVTAMYHIACSEDTPQLPPSLSEQGRDFLTLCFKRDPTRRPDVTLLLLHPWISHMQHMMPAGRVADGTGLPLRPSTADTNLDSGRMRLGSRWDSRRTRQGTRASVRPRLHSPGGEGGLLGSSMEGDADPMPTPRDMRQDEGGRGREPTPPSGTGEVIRPGPSAGAAPEVIHSFGGLLSPRSDVSDDEGGLGGLKTAKLPGERPSPPRHEASNLPLDMPQLQTGASSGNGSMPITHGRRATPRGRSDSAISAAEGGHPPQSFEPAAQASVGFVATPVHSVATDGSSDGGGPKQESRGIPPKRPLAGRRAVQSASVAAVGKALSGDASSSIETRGAGGGGGNTARQTSKRSGADDSSDSRVQKPRTRSARPRVTGRRSTSPRPPLRGGVLAGPSSVHGGDESDSGAGALRVRRTDSLSPLSGAAHSAAPEAFGRGPRALTAGIEFRAQLKRNEEEDFPIDGGGGAFLAPPSRLPLPLARAHSKQHSRPVLARSGDSPPSPEFTVAGFMHGVVHSPLPSPSAADRYSHPLLQGGDSSPEMSTPIQSRRGSEGGPSSALRSVMSPIVDGLSGGGAVSPTLRSEGGLGGLASALQPVAPTGRGLHALNMSHITEASGLDRTVDSAAPSPVPSELGSSRAPLTATATQQADSTRMSIAIAVSDDEEASQGDSSDAYGDDFESASDSALSPSPGNSPQRVPPQQAGTTSTKTTPLRSRPHRSRKKGTGSRRRRPVQAVSPRGGAPPAEEPVNPHPLQGLSLSDLRALPYRDIMTSSWGHGVRKAVHVPDVHAGTITCSVFLSVPVERGAGGTVRVVATGSADGAVVLWSPITGDVLCKLQSSDSERSRGSAFHPGITALASLPVPQSTASSVSSVSCMTRGPEGRLLLAPVAGGAGGVHSSVDASAAADGDAPQEQVAASACLLFSGADNGAIVVWHVSAARAGDGGLAMRGTVLRQLKGHSSSVRCMVAFADAPLPNASRGAADDPAPLSLEVKGTNAAVARSGRDPDPTAASAAPAGLSLGAALRSVVLVTGSADHSIRMWAPAGRDSSARAAPGRSATGAGSDTAATLSRSKALLHTLKGHSGAVNALALLPSENLLVSAGADQTVRLWHMRSGRSRGVLKDHFGSVAALLPLPVPGLDMPLPLWLSTCLGVGRAAMTASAETARSTDAGGRSSGGVEGGGMQPQPYEQYMRTGLHLLTHFMLAGAYSSSNAARSNAAGGMSARSIVASSDSAQPAVPPSVLSQLLMGEGASMDITAVSASSSTQAALRKASSFVAAARSGGAGDESGPHSPRDPPSKSFANMRSVSPLRRPDAKEGARGLNSSVGKASLLRSHSPLSLPGSSPVAAFASGALDVVGSKLSAHGAADFASNGEPPTGVPAAITPHLAGGAGGFASPTGALRPTPGPLNPVQAALRDAETVLRRVFLVSGARDGAVKCWNRKGDVLRSLKGHKGAVGVLATPPLHLMLRSLGRALEAVGIGVHTNARGVASEGSHGRALRARLEAVAATLHEMLSMGACVLSGGSDGVMRLWDVDAGRVMRVFSGHRAAITSVRWVTPTSAVSASLDGTLRVWDVPTGACVQVLVPHTGRMTTAQAAASADGSAPSGAQAEEEAAAMAEGSAAAGAAVTRLDFDGQVVVAGTRGGTAVAFEWSPLPSGAEQPQ